MNVGEAERLELVHCAFGGAHVIRGASKARADHVREIGVVFIGFAVEDRVADELADGVAGFGRDGRR